MISFKAILQKFDQQGEKTGWTYVLIPKKIAGQLKPGNKRSFRIKGKLDEFPLRSVALLPMGDGDFIMAINASMRKEIRKKKGDIVKVLMEVDNDEFQISQALVICLKDDTEAYTYFTSLPGSHQKYYSNWIESAKTDPTKTRRIALAINALSKKMSFSQMLRMQKKDT